MDPLDLGFSASRLEAVDCLDWLGVVCLDLLPVAVETLDWFGVVCFDPIDLLPVAVEALDWFGVESQTLCDWDCLLELRAVDALVLDFDF